MSRPQVSVLLPVRNGGRFLAGAVASILAQTLTSFELIVVDDGSTDGSVAKLGELVDRRVTLVRQAPLGLVAALTNALAHARSDYVARMDADDVSEPRRLERQVELLDARPEVGMVATWVTVVDEKGLELRREVLPLAHEDLARRLLLRNPFQHGSVVLRRKALEAAGGYRTDYGANEDYDLWRRLARVGELACVPEALYRYRVHAGTVTRTDLDRVTHRERLRDELWHDYDTREYRIRATVARAKAAEPVIRRGLVADQRTIAREALRRRRGEIAAKALVASALLSRG